MANEDILIIIKILLLFFIFLFWSLLGFGKKKEAG